MLARVHPRRTHWRGRRIAAALVLALVLGIGLVGGAAERAFQVEYEPSTIAPSAPLDGYDPYGQGDSIHAGTRSEVCVAGLPPGTGSFTSWALRWQGFRQAQTLSCRLVAPPPGRGSRDIPTSDQTFYDTWSSHATGRGVDLFVASTAAGDRFVDYLLADRDGSGHVTARRLGVLQIIWDGGCWEAREELSRLSVRSAEDMRTQYPCAAGASHRDHIHITLSFEGATATTSGYDLWGARPEAVLPADFFVRGATHFSRPEADGG